MILEKLFALQHHQQHFGIVSMSSSYSTVFWFSQYLDCLIIKKSMIRIMMIILLMIVCSDEWIYEMMKIFIIDKNKEE